MKTIECRSCGALITFALSPAGKIMPMDLVPVPVERAPIGGPRYELDDDVDPPQARKARPEADLVYVSHFSTCEHASSHSSIARRRL